MEITEVNARAVSRGQNELIGEFKMAAGDVISIGGYVMKYMYNQNIYTTLLETFPTFFFEKTWWISMKLACMRRT